MSEKEFKDLRKWIDEGIIYLKKDSELGRNAREQRVIAYINVRNKIDEIIRKRKVTK